MTTPASFRFCQVSWGSRGTCTLCHDHRHCRRLSPETILMWLNIPVGTLRAWMGPHVLAFAVGLLFLRRRSFSFASTWKVPTPLKETC